MQRLRGKPQEFPIRHFGRIWTATNPKPITDSRYSETFDKYKSLERIRPPENLRYMFYNVCAFGLLCQNIPGDFVCAGVSWGVGPRMLFDYADVPGSGKALHLIDPFTGIDRDGIASSYNLDADYVLRQYPENARVTLHRNLIPMPWKDPIAFLYSDTGNPIADAAALPIFYERLSPGGIILSEQYANNIQYYDAAVRKLKIEPIWLPSGQGLILKR